MEESVLKTIKKILNVDPEDTSFDLDIVTHINTAFFHLHQLGIGPEAGFAIDGPDQKWSDFIQGPIPIVSALKTNIGLRVRALWDPPQMPHVAKAMEQQLAESDWRLNTAREETEWVNPDPGFMVVDGGDPSGE